MMARKHCLVRILDGVVIVCTNKYTNTVVSLVHIRTVLNLLKENGGLRPIAVISSVENSWRSFRKIATH